MLIIVTSQYPRTGHFYLFNHCHCPQALTVEDKFIWSYTSKFKLYRNWVCKLFQLFLVCLDHPPKLVESIITVLSSTVTSTPYQVPAAKSHHNSMFLQPHKLLPKIQKWYIWAWTAKLIPTRKREVSIFHLLVLEQIHVKMLFSIATQMFWMLLASTCFKTCTSHIKLRQPDIS